MAFPARARPKHEVSPSEGEWDDQLCDVKRDWKKVIKLSQNLSSLFITLVWRVQTGNGI